MEVPDFVMEKIQFISTKTAIPQEELLRVYEEIFKDPFIQTDPQFKDDSDRHRYACAVLWARYIGRPPTREWEVIPIGISPIKLTQGGEPWCFLAVFAKEGKQTKLKKVVLRGEQATHPNINFGCIYKVQLGQFRSGDLITDSRTRWENPIPISTNLNQLIEKLGIRKCKISELKEHPSKVGSDGYVVETDWRLVQGIIVGLNQGETPDGRTWAVYTLMDDSVMPENGEVVSEDGILGRPGLSVWVHPSQTVYEQESEIIAIGNVQVGKKTKRPFMNAYIVLPVIAKVRKNE